LIDKSAIVCNPSNIGSNVYVGANAVIYDNVKIGNNVYVGSGSILGSPPEIANPSNLSEMLRYNPNQYAGVIIEDNVAIRESVIIHQGTRVPTKINSYTYIHSASIINHDAQLLNNVTIAPGAIINGAVNIGDFAQIGAGAVIHQNRIIGFLAMVGQGSIVVSDVLPMSKVYGNPARFNGVNAVALKRRGIHEDDINIISNKLLSYPMKVCLTLKKYSSLENFDPIKLTNLLKDWVEDYN
jgi:UDP-N-acetylglucosamine acyltransferase